MDLSFPLNHNVLVEMEGFSFFSDVEYEKLPAFCGHCRKYGHDVHDCKMLRIHQSNSNLKNQENMGHKLGVNPPEPVAISEEKCMKLVTRK